MEEQQVQRKIKPTFPKKLAIKTQSQYENFMKRRIKGPSNVELRKVDHRTHLVENTRDPPYVWTAKFLKATKNLKYAKKLALSNLTLCFTSYYLPKTLYFAKRMSNSQVIQIHDFKTPEQKYQGTFERFVRYIKRAKSVHYNYTARKALPRDMNQQVGPVKHNHDFIHLLKYQPHLKDLRIQFLHQSQPVTDEYWNFKRYPVSLESLSLNALVHDKPIISSLKHLENLKSLELEFYYQAKPEFISSILQSLPALSSHLQSLNLSLNETETPLVFTAFAGMRTLNNLTQLKLDLKPHKIHNFETVLASFTECPLNSLELRTIVESEGYLIPIAHFIKKFPNLENLDLEIKCHKPFNSFENAKEILKETDNLLLLKRLAISIASRPGKNQLFPEISPLFTKIFAKAIPLNCFKIQLKPMKVSNQSFLQLIQGLDPLGPNLRDLEIDIGEYRPDKSEFETVLGFVKKLQNIYYLKLGSLSVPLRQFFSEFAEIINDMPNIRILALGEIKGTVTKPACIDIIERIIKKRGLEEFDCYASDAFRKSLEKKEKKCPFIELSEVYKVNPFLRKHSYLPIFNIARDRSKIW